MCALWAGEWVDQGGMWLAGFTLSFPFLNTSKWFALKWFQLGCRVCLLRISDLFQDSRPDLAIGCLLQFLIQTNLE